MVSVNYENVERSSYIKALHVNPILALQLLVVVDPTRDRLLCCTCDWQQEASDSDDILQLFIYSYGSN